MPEPKNPSLESPAAALAQMLAQQRAAAHDALSGHRERFRRLEATLAERLRDLDRDLVNQQHELTERERILTLDQNGMRGESAQLIQLRDQTAAEQSRWKTIEAELALGCEQFSAIRDEALAGQRDLSNRQRELLAEISRAQAELVAAQKKLEESRADFLQRREQLEAEERELDIQLQSVESQATLLAQRAADLERREKQIEETQARLHQLYANQAQAARQQEAAVAAIDAQRVELAKQRESLLEQQNLVEQRSADTQAQRRRLARELTARRSSMLAELERQRAKLERQSAGGDIELRERLAVAAAERDRVRDDLQRREEQLAKTLEEFHAQHRKLDAHASELELLRTAADKTLAETQLKLLELQRSCDDARSQADSAKAALVQSREEEDQLRNRLVETRERLDARDAELNQLRALTTNRTAAAMAAAPELERRVEELRLECDSLREQLLASEGGQGNADSQVADLRRRLELALQDLRGFKSRNAELEANLARRNQGKASPAASMSANGPLDWEAQKRLFLAQLEADNDDHLEPVEQKQRAADRIQINEIVRITDAALAAKDREIADLERLLAEQSKGIAGVAVGANAIAAMLDQDEFIRNERENLKRLQDELQQKLREAEVSISVERAAIARERLEMQDKLAEIAKQAKKEGSADEKNAKPNRNRWLSRLGLGDNEPRE